MAAVVGVCYRGGFTEHVCVCVCKCLSHVASCIIFDASPAMLPRGSDTHSSVPSHIKARVTAAEIPECSSEWERGGRRGEKRVQR